VSDFIPFKDAVQKQFDKIQKTGLFVTEADKDLLWEAYLEAIPAEHNPIFRERREYDCSCCKNFIRNLGNVVTIVDNKIVTLWDFEVEGFWQGVADKLSSLVKEQHIRDVYFHYENHVGTDFNHEMLEGVSKKWDHFYVQLPSQFVKRKDSIPSALGDIRSNKDVLLRSLSEITIESAQTVVELIEQGTLYRGEEHKGIVDTFLKYKKAFDKLQGEARDNFVWTQSLILKGASKIRNTVIGTLLSDLSEGRELDAAVGSFEQKVAPTNYKRPTALITPTMIKKAQEKVEELGIGDSLLRRYAIAEDLTINNVIYADRAAKKAMNVFDQLTEESSNVKVDSLSKVEEVSVDKFINDIIPKADTVELMLENRHQNNLVSLIAPVSAASPNILKWDNNFSWSYNGEVTDSIKERVKAAGGNVSGILRCSLSWFNHDDLDIHVIEPNGNRISFRSKRSSTSGVLDVDMNAGGGTTRTPVENIVWTDPRLMKEGRYKLTVNQFSRRETSNVGFDAEIEYGGEIINFSYDKAVSGDVVVAEFNFSFAKGIEMINSLPSSMSSKTYWGVDTQKFHKVKMIMNSPNHWDGHTTGNKHLFFILDGCLNDKPSRGFYNEFLNEGLNEHRKVFEVLGSKMKTEESNNQLSGLGFSSTQRNHAYFKVTGSFNRTIKVVF
jgi:hypothetical protein